jgi:hypothetical protein
MRDSAPKCEEPARIHTSWTRNTIIEKKASDEKGIGQLLLVGILINIFKHKNWLKSQ